VAHVSAAPEIAKIATARAGAAPAPATPPTLDRAAAAPLARRLAARVADGWLARAAWTVGRTGRPGIVGIALLLAAALFLVSTHLPVAAEVEALRTDVAAAQGRARPVATDAVADPTPATRALPSRTEMPSILRQLFEKATQARLAVDTGKYEVDATRSSGVVRYRIAFPVTGTYPQIRAFLDSTLATMPAVALGELALERKSIADANVDAQLRLTVYTSAAGTVRVPGTPSAADRVVQARHAPALFAQHSRVLPAPAPPPAPPPPAPAPSAPPLPYAFLGSFAPEGEAPVFFLARGDRVIDARVGDRLDGVYQLESAAGGQLVFVYLPLGSRQTLAAGVTK
jgi:hypothetical protein